MDFINCAVCGSIVKYPGFGSRLCPVCRVKDEEDFAIIKDYLIDHPGANEQEVSVATGISHKKIMRWLREERLVDSNTGIGMIFCDKCGERIQQGRLCDKCKRQMITEFGYNRSNPEEKKVSAQRQGARMRYIGSSRF